MLLVLGTDVPFGWAKLLSCQLVAQREPSLMLSGSADDWRYVPAISHPPTNASKARFIFEPNLLWRPNGSCHTPRALIECRTSKRETARSECGSHELIRKSEVKLTWFSDREERSIDFPRE